MRILNWKTRCLYKNNAHAGVLGEQAYFSISRSKTSHTANTMAYVLPSLPIVLNETRRVHKRKVDCIDDAVTHVRRARRKTKHLPCNGKCGGANCTYIADCQSHLDRHCNKGTKNHNCNVCGGDYSRKDSLTRHMRTNHPEHCDKIPSKQWRPPPFNRERVNAAAAALSLPPIPESFKQEHFSFLKNNIRQSEKDDYELKRIMTILTAPERHELTYELVLALHQKGYLCEQTGGAKDDAGGHILLQYSEHCFGQVSLDRIDNNLPHFVRDAETGKIKNPTGNIRFVILQINTRANIVVKHGKQTCSEFKSKEQTKSYTQAKIEMMLSASKNDTNKLYRTMKGGLQRDKKKTWSAADQKLLDKCTEDNMFEYCKKLFRAQQGRCYVSGIEMTVTGSVYQTSLERINVRRPHIPGNVRLIAMPFNCIDRSSEKHLTKEELQTLKGGAPLNCGWTPERYDQYVYGYVREQTLERHQELDAKLRQVVFVTSE